MAFLDPVLGPLLTWPPIVSIFVVSFLITLLSTLVYKYTTDQKRMRELRAKTKEFQQKMRSIKDPQKLLKVQQEAMGYNLEMMKHSFKPMLYTMIPLLIVFAWLNGHMAYYNLAPQQEFTLTATLVPGTGGSWALELIPVNGVVVLDGMTKNVSTVNGVSIISWRLKGDAGTYKATIRSEAQSVEKAFIIASDRRYEAPVQRYQGLVQEVKLSNAAIHPFGSFYIPWFGGARWYMGWLATYIIISIAVSVGLRKILNVV
jgi:uncharacterized membrane protein (DUF106 family)